MTRTLSLSGASAIPIGMLPRSIKSPTGSKRTPVGNGLVKFAGESARGLVLPRDNTKQSANVMQKSKRERRLCISSSENDPDSISIPRFYQTIHEYTSSSVQWNEETLKFEGYSARIVPDRKSDGQADAEPVLDKFASLVNQRHMAIGSRRERQYDHVHKEIDQSAVDETEQDGAAN